MNQVYHILKYKLFGYLKLTYINSLKKLLKELGSSVVYLAFAVGAFLFSLTTLEFILVDVELGLFLLHEFLSIIFFIFFISINVGNVLVAWSTLYKSDETSFLFTKPVKPANIFIIKFFDNIFYSSSTMLLILLSLFLGYVTYFKLNILTLLFILIFNLLPFIINSASLGVIVLLIIVKLASKLGAPKVIGTLVLLYIASMFFFFKLSSPARLVYQVMAQYPNVDQYFGYLTAPVIKFLPNKWFADSLYWIVRDEFTKSIPSMFFQIGAAVISLSIAIFLGGKWYYKTWLQNISLKLNFIKDDKDKVDKLFDKLISWDSPASAIIKKDFLLFFRDSSQVIHFSVLMALILIFMSSVSGISLMNFKDPELTAVIYSTLIIFNILLISTLSLRFVFPMLSLEGQTFWKTKTSPLKVMNLVNIKLFPIMVFVILVGQLLNYFANLKLAPHLIPLTAIMTLLVSISLVMFNFGMGVIFVRYKEKNPIRISSSQGASLTFLFSMIYMAVILVILIFPLTYHFNLIFSSYYYHYNYIHMAVYVISVLSVIISVFFYLAGIKYLKVDF